MSKTVLNTPNRSISALNEYRQKAVRMRLDGATLAETSRVTGLTAPTIIAAFKAYQAGGWEAVDTRRRGRPVRGNEALTRQTEAHLKQVLLSRSPQQEALANHHVWDLDAVDTWLQTRHGLEIPARSIARVLQRWKLSSPSMLEQARDNARLSSWFSGPYRRFQSAARRHDGQVLWLGEARLPDDGPYLLYAHTTRGHMYWQTVAAQPLIADWQTFFDHLNQRVGVLYAVVSNPFLLRSAALGQWLQTRTTPIAALGLGEDTPAATVPPGRPAIVQSKSDSPDSNKRPNMLLTHLQRLEAESIHIMREVVAEAENPVMMYSIGKDSAVMLHLARKAFYPAPPPFPLLHVDTRWKFRDMYAMRDRMAQELGMKLLVHINPEGIEKDVNPFTHGSALHTDIMKTEGLKQALNKHGFDAAFGGARRDEEKSRAKERVFSFRTAQHQWDPKNQRPELWKVYNARKHNGESIRVFPLSNWTELDIWQYIYLENIPIVPLYYSALRPVVERDGTLIMVDDDRMPLKPGEVPMMKKVRFRTLGCYPLTGAVESEADTLPAIIQEMLLTRTSERQGRVIDHDSAASMEKKKQEGYF